MKPVTQTITKGPLANCLQAAIASILEKPIEAVPNFSKISDEEWNHVYLAWLEKQGYAVIYCYEHGFRKEFSNAYGYHLINVHSPRGDFLHALVGLNGVPVHDPYPGGNCQHKGIYSYEFFVPIISAEVENG